MNAAQRLQHVLKTIHQHAIQQPVILVAVSKQRSVQDILELYELGVRDFAENRLEEAKKKTPLLPPDICWHWIGRIQTNKISKILENFQFIQSVDSFEHAKMISRLSRHPISLLLQANVSKEQSKAGFSAQQWIDCFEQLLQLPHLKIQGLMTMAPHTQDLDVLKHCFGSLKKLQQQLQTLAQGRVDMATLSMGMSQDYIIALQEGATMVRIGRALFDSTI
ncbi:MAG: YggS family pyridoxal phosphate-dependent enzyme [Verrucomicrobia bacterium]|nr:YggS family pyridoxal phosphate-dependent enzyme [Verrucomicrobiota bacterium]MBS0646757.1 YggS family pyridoxal phosphate-dependent enzyme [Verrucomicrobiota bacterium]